MQVRGCPGNPNYKVQSNWPRLRNPLPPTGTENSWIAEPKNCGKTVNHLSGSRITPPKKRRSTFKVAWLTDSQIDIAIICETHIHRCYTLRRDNYVWYFGGDDTAVGAEKSGMAVIVKSNCNKYLVEVTPVNDMLIRCVLNSHCPIGVHMHAAT